MGRVIIGSKPALAYLIAEKLALLSYIIHWRIPTYGKNLDICGETPSPVQLTPPMAQEYKAMIVCNI